MVRIVSQNFSPPRSRHSSGETDLDLAERTKSALATLGRKRIDLLPEYESSSDSFWDSEFDCDHTEEKLSEADSERADINGNDPKEKSDVQSKRKQRRRERNKLSAQAYRQRRRHQTVKEKQDLMSLESENKRLHKLVESLEKEKEQAKQYLRGMVVPMPDILSPVGEEVSSDFLENEPCGAEAAAEPIPPIHVPFNKQFPHPQETTTETPFPHASTPIFHTMKDPNPPLPFQHNMNGNSHPSDNQLNSLQPPADATSPQHSPIVNHSPSGVHIQPHILINAPTLLTAPVSTNENSNGATAAGPTYFAVPIVEPTTQCFPPPTNLNALQNANQGLTHVITPEPNKNLSSNWLGQTAVIGTTTTQVLGTTWNAPLNGNTLFSIVKMEMCNSNSNANFSNNHNEMPATGNNILSDDNGNQNSCNTMTMRAVNPQLVSFKINLNHSPGLHPQPSAVEDLKSQGLGLTGIARPSGSTANSDQAIAMHVQ